MDALERTRPAWVDDDLFPFESRFVEVDGNVVHYVDEGTGPALLMLHGNPTWSFLYRDLIARLRDAFRCVALDYPGFGLSAAREGYTFLPREHAGVVRAFVERLDLRDATVFGQDWGGPIGLATVRAMPGRFRALVIGNTWGWPLDGDAHFERFSKLMGGPVGGFLIRQLNVFVNVFLPYGHRRTRLSRAELRQYRGPFPTPASRKPMHVFPRELLESRELLSEVERGLPSLAHLPVLFVWGDRDFALRRQELERFERAFPRHTTHVLHGASHFVQDDAGDEIARVLREWWPGA